MRWPECSADIIFLYPLHPNPILREFVDPLIKDCVNIKLIPPLIYSDLIIAMKRSSLILTDSGGIQEEAPSFGVHVLVLRDDTERLEGVTAGLATLVGTNTDKIVAVAKRHLDGKYKTLSNSSTSGKNPYGDGHAAARILEILSKYLLN